MYVKGTLLIIDDEIEVLNDLKRIFYKDYQLYLTQSSKKAFSILKRFNIEVILCDQFMPEIKGDLFLKKAKELYPDTIGILTTGHTELTNIIKSNIDDSIFRYVTKPWNTLELKESVRQAFKKNTFIRKTSIMVEALKNSNIISEGKTREKTRKLEENNEILKKSLTSQEEFTTNISHELKTPLNVISAAVQLLSMYCNNGSLDAKKTSVIKYLDEIKQNSYRLSKLINNIVDSSKIESGFFELHLSNNNIVEIVEEIVMSIIAFTDSKGLNIIFDTDIEEKVIACDPEKIERVVLNLISNSIKFSDKGDKIFVNVKDKNQFVEISVKDTGIGIEKKHLDAIFDRFNQVEKSLSRNAEGTGIGLSLVKSIVELHNGRIHVESEVDKGSKFTIMLPSKKVLHENRVDNKMRNKNESIQVELSDITIL